MSSDKFTRRRLAAEGGTKMFVRPGQVRNLPELASRRDGIRSGCVERHSTERQADMIGSTLSRRFYNIYNCR